MTTNRIIIVLLSLAVLMQGASLYRQYHPSQQKAIARENPVRDAPKGTIMDTKGLPRKGAADAKVALVEFSDYECPFCSRYETGAANDLEKEFVQTGKLMLAFANNPLPIHSNAKLLAIAAICAGYQGKYWEMHDKLFTLGPKASDELSNVIETLSMDTKQFQQCTDKNPEPAKQIGRDMKKAQEFELTGTPSFAIGHVNSEGQVNIEKFIVGSQPLARFQETIKAVLAEPVGLSAPPSPAVDVMARN